MNPIKELVSIITPIYNSGKTIKFTIDSIINQTYPNWELIMVNDASSDESLQIARVYCAKDKRIKCLTLTQNVGVAKARNLAIDSARGQYIAFLDADDTWDSTKLEKQIRFMKNNNYAFTYTGYRTTKGRIIKTPASLNYKQLIVNNQIGCLTVVIDRRMTGEFMMPDHRKGQDHLTWLMLMKRGFPAYGLNEILATYTEGNMSSLSGNKLKSAKRQWSNYRHALGLGFFQSLFYFVQYAYHSLRKYGFRL